MYQVPGNEPVAVVEAVASEYEIAAGILRIVWTEEQALTA